MSGPSGIRTLIWRIKSPLFYRYTNDPKQPSQDLNLQFQSQSLACSHYTKELWQICSGTIRNLRIWRPPCYSFTPQIYITKTAFPISGKRYQSTVWKPGYCYVSTWNLPVIDMICFFDTGMTNPRSWQNQKRFSSCLCCLQIIV